MNVMGNTPKRDVLNIQGLSEHGTVTPFAIKTTYASCGNYLNKGHTPALLLQRVWCSSLLFAPSSSGVHVLHYTLEHVINATK